MPGMGNEEATGGTGGLEPQRDLWVKGHTDRQGLTLAGFAVLQRLAVVPGVSVLAVLAVASGCVVAALETDAPTVAARLLKHLHAESALV